MCFILVLWWFTSGKTIFSIDIHHVISLLFMLLVSLFILSMCMSGYRIRLGVSDEGAYVDHFGWFRGVWIPWKNVTDLQVIPYSSIGLFKKTFIILRFKKGSKTKKVPILCKKGFDDEVFHNIKETIQNYIDKSKEGQ